MSGLGAEQTRKFFNQHPTFPPLHISFLHKQHAHHLPPETACRSRGPTLDSYIPFCRLCGVGSPFTAMRRVKIFSGSSHPELTESICERLGTTPGKCDLRKFSNGETSVDIGCSIRDQDVFIVQSGSQK